MVREKLFRLLFLVIFASALSISGYFRWKARKTGDVIPRAREGKRVVWIRVLFGVPMYLAFFAYLVNPAWMAWSALPLPAWVRWFGAGAGFGMLPAIYWVVSSLGRNISETFLTKERQVLVTHGPYRWVRHPLYSVGTVLFFSLGLLAANWFMMAMASLALALLSLLVIPREEAELTRKFGPAYREYMSHTGRLAPRLRASN